MLSKEHCLKQIDKFNLNNLTKKTLITRLSSLNNKKFYERCKNMQKYPFDFIVDGEGEVSVEVVGK